MGHTVVFKTIYEILQLFSFNNNKIDNNNNITYNKNNNNNNNINNNNNNRKSKTKWFTQTIVYLEQWECKKGILFC